MAPKMQKARLALPTLLLLNPEPLFYEEVRMANTNSTRYWSFRRFMKFLKALLGLVLLALEALQKLLDLIS